MRPNRSAAPWRAALLTAVVLGATIPIAEAADPADQTQRPFVVVVSNGAKGQAVAKDHGRRFGVSAERVYDRIGGYRASMTTAQAKALGRQPGVVVAEDTRVHTVADATGSPE